VLIIALETAPGLLSAEKLDRGLVALPMANGRVYLSWRLLESDPAHVGFQVLRSEQPAQTGRVITAQPVTDSCNFIDDKADGKTWYYRVQPEPAPATLASGKPASTVNSPSPFVRIKLRGKYRPQKVGLADLDGDGALDYLIKQPDFNADPYQQPGYWKKSEDTYKLEAYQHDGTFMWSYDMGWAIEEGVWYSPMIVYDLDDDGKAEVICKAGEGDPREITGHVRSGSEYIVLLDGLTGKIKNKLPWPSREGFTDYNYYSRNLLGIAYLDGQHPSLIVVRGTYTLIKVEAYDASLELIWRWEASGAYEKFRGKGMHGLHAADLDEDGRDELILGSAVLDDNGQPLWNRPVGHPDICYVADIDPGRPGLEIFFGIEPRQRSNAVCLVEGRTGRMIWGNPEPTVHVHGQGMVGDIDPNQPGMECFAGEAKGGTNYWLYSASGKRLSSQSLGELSPKAVYWLDGPTKVIVRGGSIMNYPGSKVGEISGRVVAIADCLGDWREEIITALEGELRVYSTLAPSNSRRICLMQDRLYRSDVAMQTMGYFYPPQLGLPRRQTGN
jgi:rhamnogalacturonan endolyase